MLRAEHTSRRPIERRHESLKWAAARQLAVLLVRGLMLVSFVGALLTTPTPAHAKKPAAESKKPTAVDDEYKLLVRGALAAFDAKDWERAQRLFAAAHALDPNARTLRGMGMVAFEMEDFVKAYQLLRAALAEPRRALDADLRARTEQLLKRTRLLVGRVRMTVTPAYASVKIDNETVDTTRELWLTIGLHLVTVQAQGHGERKLNLDIRNGDDQNLNVALDPISLAVPADAAPNAERHDAIALQAQADERDEVRSSLLNQWWFWAAAAGLVGVGVGATLLATQSHEPADKPQTKGTNGLVVTTLSLP